jgi:hypothetical protein
MKKRYLYFSLLFLILLSGCSSINNILYPNVGKGELYYNRIKTITKQTVESGIYNDLFLNMQIINNMPQKTVYELDKRELFDINEVRLFFQKLFDQVDGAFYWLDPNSYMLLFWGLMLLTPIRVDGQVTLEPKDLQKYLTWGFIKLNKFCKDHDISPEPSNNEIFAVIKDIN